MQRWQGRLVGLVMIVMSVGGGGCFPMGSLDGPGDADVMNLWQTYSHCRASSDPDVMRSDAEHLFHAAQIFTVNAQAIPFPDFMPLQSLLSKLPSRLTVDPRAMAMACTLYAAQTAQSLGRLVTATEMFTSVLTATSELRYAYYVIQAERGLKSFLGERS